MPTVILATLNARYIHASLGLRYLYANMGDLRQDCGLLEFTIMDRPRDVAEAILARSPKIVGFGVYIWNVDETCRIVRILKRLAPDISVVLGGPEVSYETEGQAIVQAADYVIAGPGDLVFPELCRGIHSVPARISPTGVNFAA
jgi:radical SAM superfamily enzyme YgiQ (UPF0313 family)